MRQTIARRAGATALVDYILEQPALLQAVRELPPRALKRLIDRTGLEAAGEILALANSEQLQGVFDADLWFSERAGADERFDAARFALWLEVLVEQGAAFAARTLAELDPDLLTLALCNLLLVIDIDTLSQRVAWGGSDDDRDLLERALESGTYHEFEQYRVIARDLHAWDVLLCVLCEWNERDYATLGSALARCCAVSIDYIEDNGGLYEVLENMELAELDAGSERAERRAAAGYMAPSDARAFLRLALETPRTELLTQPGPDAITRAYFRSLAAADPGPRQQPARRMLTAQAASAPQLQELLAVLEEDEVPRRLAAGAKGGPAPKLGAALRRLSQSRPELHAQRLQEAAYLANVVLAGLGLGPSGMRPVEAAEAALWLCELGAQQLVSRARGLSQLVEETSLVTLLQIGFQRLIQLEKAPPALGALHALLAVQGWRKASEGPEKPALKADRAAKPRAARARS
jgi:hypothetical protein